MTIINSNSTCHSHLSHQPILHRPKLMGNQQHRWLPLFLSLEGGIEYQSVILKTHEDEDSGGNETKPRSQS